MKDWLQIARWVVAVVPLLILIGIAEMGAKMDTYGDRYFDRLMDWVYGHRRWRYRR